MQAEGLLYNGASTVYGLRSYFFSTVFSVLLWASAHGPGSAS